MNEFAPIEFVETDARRIERELLGVYEEALGHALYPGDPRRMFLLQMLPVLMALRNDINYTGNANLLPFASGATLDALGLRLGITRLPADAARTELRFTLSGIQAAPIVIPQGTRVTPDGVIYFATVQTLTLQPGETEGVVTAAAILAGQAHNGFLAGQIKLLVDPLPYVAAVVNVTTSASGSDAESDEAFRERQRLAPASFSVAGPKQAYEYYAKSANIDIADVAVLSPGAGEIRVYPLLRGGLLPDAAMLAKVLAEVSSDSRRPLTDHVEVMPPEAIHYNIDLTYYIARERAGEEAVIRRAVEGSGGAVEEYGAWQSAKLGRAITPDALISRIYGAGAYRVVMKSPVFAEVEPYQVARMNNEPSLVYGGLI
jgi:phage-related baseplate assembly protein